MVLCKKEMPQFFIKGKKYEVLRIDNNFWRKKWVISDEDSYTNGFTFTSKTNDYNYIWNWFERYSIKEIRKEKLRKLGRTSIWKL